MKLLFLSYSRFLSLAAIGFAGVGVFDFECTAQDRPVDVVVEAGYKHLGDSTLSDWDGVSAEPDGFEYSTTFEAKEVDGASTLLVRHRDVDNSWLIQINGVEIAQLKTVSEEGDHYYEIPASVLKDGENVLELVPQFERTDASNDDDIAFGHIRLFNQSLRELLSLRVLRIRIRDGVSGDELPARISISSTTGERPKVHYPMPESVAVRSGLVYANGEAQIELPEGSYRIVATRGMEWSRGVQNVELKDSAEEVVFELVREVDTSGYVAADTHIHTLQFSGHGDASAAERIVTLGGEGIELAIATDHNHNIDYRPFQEKLEMNDFFTSVVGNEVTSTNGHFNAFPLDPDGEVPIFDESDWVKMVDDMRLKGAKVVILNHPNWPDEETGPFGVFNLNRANGDREFGSEFTFDAMELINSTVNTPDPLYLFHDWFALLNRGERIFAVGVSDSHTVGDPVGQGRTYIKSRVDDPGNLDVDELCDNILAGRMSVSLGIYAEATFDGEYQSGDLVPISDGMVEVSIKVRSPSWVTPSKAIVFLNGEPKAEQNVPSVPGSPTDATLTFKIPARGLDAHLVCVILGEPVLDSSWKTLNGYTLAATNPVFLDVNGDGKFQSLRDSAKRVLSSLRGDNEALFNTLGILPPVLAVQLIALVDSTLSDSDRERLQSILEFRASGSDVFKRYQNYTPRLEK